MLLGEYVLVVHVNLYFEVKQRVFVREETHNSPMLNILSHFEVLVGTLF